MWYIQHKNASKQSYDLILFTIRPNTSQITPDAFGHRTITFLMFCIFHKNSSIIQCSEKSPNIFIYFNDKQALFGSKIVFPNSFMSFINYNQLITVYHVHVYVLLQKLLRYIDYVRGRTWSLIRALMAIFRGTVLMQRFNAKLCRNLWDESVFIIIFNWFMLIDMF